MSSSTAASAPFLNGNAPFHPDFLREAAFLDKLLQLRDEVYAGKHPRIKLPTSVLEQVVPRPTQKTPPVAAKPPTANGIPNGSAFVHPLPARPENSVQAHHIPNDYNPPSHHAPRPFPAKHTSSGIDPVLLTKSEHLIRAELQLKRQQIERLLKDQFDRRGRGNDILAEDRAALDVESILAKAQALVKPISGLPVVQTREGSESFDENSYYSSKANSWSSEEADNKVSDADVAENSTSQAQRSAKGAELTAVNPKPPKITRVAQPAVIDLDDEPYEPMDDIELYEPEPPTRLHEDQEESDYSPPPADVGPSQPNRGRRDRAPNNGNSNGSSRQQSPSGNPAPIQNSRKRRRDERREEKRRQQANKRVVRSPEPYIKEEPQSPPPFASYSDSQPSKRRALQPVPNVEATSPNDGRPQPIYYRDGDQSPRFYRAQEEPPSPTVIRVPQRRDDQDLRRVASLQYARRPYSPLGEQHPVPESHQIRAASHAFAERPVEHLYREVSARPSAAPRYVREHSRSPIHEYLSGPQSPSTMAPPPPRKIVVDQYGNKYYAAPVDIRESAAPPTRRMEAEPFYERAATREPTVRAPIRQDIYGEEQVHRMPPPPPRRYVEASDAEPLEPRSYRIREASHRPVEVVERRPIVQYEEMGPPREYMPSRAYSMRPEGVRREPLEYAPARHESVQPGFMGVAAPRYREVSVIQEPYDDRRFTYAAPARVPAPVGLRYVEEPATEGLIDAPGDLYGGAEPRRVSYRY
ncbi:hypothetical protein BU24DRAFT_427454 [Aaosphaeria arxii CBS 175.79]|uniref:Uncharacterized protein n=1 Tax=Aaosphaeria arxii CBS 175.79 TaxID=1450172 RepID=A0A6A5XBQ8_9PLEO|nr:uncharacterized protein BU24DRAFT_427454 [Aaosphaeria arxii CBS 175.79]KAF2010329.1 hypothetical protein BU24DRAFT_427454 [Aaosphaeria arxii CBS 175.79]